MCQLGTAYSNSVGLSFFCRCAGAIFTSGCNVGIFTHRKIFTEKRYSRCLSIYVDFFCVVFMEIVGSEWRTFVGIGYQIGYAVGYMLWSAVAYLYKDWQQMQVNKSLLSLIKAWYFFSSPLKGTNWS